MIMTNEVIMLVKTILLKWSFYANRRSPTTTQFNSVVLDKDVKQILAKFRSEELRYNF